MFFQIKLKLKKMKAYRIQHNNLDAIYEGNSETEVLDNYARDAGYLSYKDMNQQVPDAVDGEETVTEVPTPRTTAEALQLDEEEWETFVMHNAGICNAHDWDDNGLHLWEILEKGSRQKILKYLGWY